MKFLLSDTGSTEPAVVGGWAHNLMRETATNGNRQRNIRTPDGSPEDRVELVVVDIVRVENELGVSINEATIRSLTGADRK